jgi:uncharacterized protein YcnI
MTRLRWLVASAILGLVVAATTPAAFAHVSIEPPAAEPGSFATLVFRVPNEQADAATTKVRVQLPPDHPMASVLVRPVPGWSITLEKTPPAEGQQGNLVDTVSVIAWEGGRIEPGYYEDFEVSLGPLPDDADVLYFPTVQYYENSTEVAWIERPSADGSEPENPAPELLLTSGVAGSRDAHGQVVVDDASESAAGATATDSDDSTTAVVIASLSLGIALVALAAAAVAWFKIVRRPPSAPTDP